MRVSLVTICTREKLYDHPRKLTQSDFQQLTRRLWREDELGHLRTPAGLFYVGLPQRRLNRGIGLARRARIEVDQWVLSAGYGLIHESMAVVPYDISFNGMDAARRRSWGEHLSLPDTMSIFLEAPADLRLVLLTDPYLQACQLSADAPLGAPTVCVVSARGASWVPRAARSWVLERADVSRFGTPAVALRQQLGALVLGLLADRGPSGLEALLAADGGWRDVLEG